MTTETIIRPEGQDHRAVGQRYWTVPQCEALIGRDVEVRDWYATFRARVEGVAEVSERTGFVTLLTLTYEGREGTVTRPFSLNVTREMAIQDEEDEEESMTTYVVTYWSRWSIAYVRRLAEAHSEDEARDLFLLEGIRPDDIVKVEQREGT